MELGKISKVLIKIFGSRNERLVKAYSVIARRTVDVSTNTQVREYSLLVRLIQHSPVMRMC